MVMLRFNVQLKYSNSMIFKNSLSASWLVRELSGLRLDWQRVGLSARCPVSLHCPSTSVLNPLYDRRSTNLQSTLNPHFIVRLWSQDQTHNINQPFSYSIMRHPMLFVCLFWLVRDNNNLNSHKYVCITTYQPDTESNPNPNPNPITKQHAIVNIQPNIVTYPTYPDKFTRGMLLQRLWGLRLYLAHCLFWQYELTKPAFRIPFISASAARTTTLF